MKNIALTFFLLAAVTAFGQNPAVTELQTRNGLPDFFNKIKKGDSVAIAYLGGSITSANGYRLQTVPMFRALFPGIRLRSINAGLGGTGSDLGVFRVKDNVIDHHPDLVFIEFAVNDSGTDSLTIGQSMEGIIRQIKRANPKTDICLLYTLAHTMVEDLKAGKSLRSARIMEKLAAYYGLPSISFAPRVIDLLKKDQLVFKVADSTATGNRIAFSIDGVHPIFQGHLIYTAAIHDSFEILAKLNTKPVKKLPEPLYPYNSEQAKYLSPGLFEHSAGWKTLTPGHPLTRFATAFPDFIYTDNPADSLVINYKGRLLGVEDILGPNSSGLLATIDGGKPIRKQRFDIYSSNPRRHYFYFDPMTEGAHRVVIRLDTTWIDKTRIVKPETVLDPARFKANYLYLGRILMIGEPGKN
jgi:lysophospholipase L1-like esterase